MKENIILIGGGGHCKSVIDVIESIEKYIIIGIIDQKERIGEVILGYKIIGSDDNIDDLIRTCQNFHITVGHIKSNQTRVKLYNLIKSKGGHFPVIISSNAYVSKHAVINEGTIIMHHAFVNSSAKIGVNCIINTSAVIEHDSEIGNHCHISTGAFINGECKVGENSFIGSNSTLIQSITIGENNLIAAGSVVTKSTEPDFQYAGNPAKLKKKTQ